MARLSFAVSLMLSIAAVSAVAQSSELVERVAAEDRVMMGDAMLLAGVAAGSLDESVGPDAAADALRALGFRIPNIAPGEPATASAVSLAIVQLYDISGGLLYSITAAGHYARLELVSRGIVPEDWHDGSPVRGSDLLAMLSDAAALSGSSDGDLPTTFDYSGSLVTRILRADGVNAGRVAVNDRLNLNLSLRHGSGAVSADYTVAGWTALGSESDPRGDLSLLNARIVFARVPVPASLFTILAGRQLLQDTTGYIVDQPADGITLSLELPGASIDLGGYYLGLLFKRRNNVILSPADLADLSDPTVVLGPPRVVARAAAQFPDLLASQAVSLDLLGQFDLRQSAETYDSYFAALDVAGTLSPIIGQNSSALLNIGTRSTSVAPEIGLLVSTSWRLLLNEFHDTQFDLEAVFASGDTGPFSNFRALDDPPTGVIFSSRYQNLVRLAAAASIEPLSQVSAAWLRPIAPYLEARSYFRTDLSPPVGADPGGGLLALPSGTFYYGTEVETGVRYDPVRDLSVSLTFGLFLPYGGQLRTYGSASFEIGF